MTPKASRNRKLKSGDRVKPTPAAIRALTWCGLERATRATVLPRTRWMTSEQVRLRIDGSRTSDTYADTWWVRA